MKTVKKPSFARALRAVRQAKALPQEAFDLVSSRTYISTLERGIKNPTIAKVTELSAVCGVHPLTMLALSFCRTAKRSEYDQLLSTVRAELEALGFADF
jgi:transcriptional regulator with XRE-family HTH domain